MERLFKTSGPVFTPDDRINLYYLNQLYGNIANYVSHRLLEIHQIEASITSGVWGGTYLITDERGKSLRRIWRLYSTVNLPQNTPLDRQENLEKLVSLYCDAVVECFRPYGMEMSLKMWGGRLPFTNKVRPNITLHMEDASKRINWLRSFFVWNQVTWEESVIYDTVRLTKELKQSLDYQRGPVDKDHKELKYLMQDVIITYRTLEKACSPEFLEHAEPIIAELTQHFLMGLFDPKLIRELYLKIFENHIVYGLEEALDSPYAEGGLDIRRVEGWPPEKINWVPDILKEKLIPPIQILFAKFKANLENPALKA